MFIQIERMARAAVPLPEALEHAAAVLGGAAEAPQLDLAQRLAAGADLLGEMQRLPGYFDAIDLAMISAAQHTGKLPEVAHRLAERHAHSAGLRSQLLGSLAYPAFLVISSLLLSPVQELMTQGIGAYLLEVATSLGILAAVCVGAWLGLRQVQRAPGRWDGLGRLEPVPGLGYLLRARRFSLVFDVLAMALQAGLPLGRALELAGAAPGERAMTAAMQKSLQSLRTSPLSASVAHWPGAPAKTKERLAAAERSGHLPEVFAELAGEARERLTVGLRRALVLLRGLITAVAIVVVAWSLISQVSKLAQDPFAAIPGEEGEQLRRELEQALPGLLEKQIK
ncbi:MAG: type II secretion system F family protein [Deltaproteobacteria bacterium]|nr:type II secretion system F family protein [Deltaproteobacteria bacterium]